jgi:transposase
MSAPGIGWVLAFTIAAEIGAIERFASPEKLAGYSGLCPRVNQSGERIAAARSPKHGPTYLRWALLEATMHALKHPAYAQRYQRTKRRLGKQRGAKVAHRHRPSTHPRDLAHAFSQPAVRPQRRRFSSGGVTALFGHAPASEASNFA